MSDEGNERKKREKVWLEFLLKTLAVINSLVSTHKLLIAYTNN